MLRHLRQSRRAFTLVEMIIAILVIGLIMGVSVMGINSITHSRLREESGRLAAVVRAVYTLAALNGRTYRIVFDLDQGSYYMEYSEDPVLLSPERTRADRGAKPEDADEKRRDRGILGLGMTVPRLPKPGWNKVTRADVGLLDEDKKEVKLQKDIAFAGVFTTHQTEVYTAGKTEMYFFPQGWAERAIIYLKEKGPDPAIFSVEVAPLTGRARVHAEKITIPSEDLEERGKEDEGESIF